MKISAIKDNLSYGVQIVQRAVSSKNPLPILSGILVKASNGQLTFTATDLELGVECKVPITVIEDGGVVLPAKYFSEIVRRLPDVVIDIDVNKENNSTLIKYGKSEFSLLGLSVEDFPMLPSIGSEATIKVKQDVFKNMIKQVSFATSTDDNRPIFTGVLMEIENDNIKLIATDTHRLAFRSGKIGESETVKEKSVIIPGKTLNELNRIMNSDNEDLIIAFGDNQVVFEMPGIKLISRLIEGQFPNYKQVIPEGCKTKIKLKTKELLEATERASLLAKDGSNVIKLTVSQEILIINSSSPEVGKIEEQISINSILSQEIEKKKLKISSFFANNSDLKKSNHSFNIFGFGTDRGSILLIMQKKENKELINSANFKLSANSNEKIFKLQLLSSNNETEFKFLAFNTNSVFLLKWNSSQKSNNNNNDEGGVSVISQFKLKNCPTVAIEIICDFDFEKKSNIDNKYPQIFLIGDCKGGIHAFFSNSNANPEISVNFHNKKSKVCDIKQVFRQNLDSEENEVTVAKELNEKLIQLYSVSSSGDFLKSFLKVSFEKESESLKIEDFVLVEENNLKNILPNLEKIEILQLLEEKVFLSGFYGHNFVVFDWTEKTRLEFLSSSFFF